MQSERRHRTIGGEHSNGWIELGADGAAVGGERLSKGVYLVQVIKGFRVKSQHEIVLRFGLGGWRWPDGRYHGGSMEVKQRCQWLAELPGELQADSSRSR